MTYSNQQGTGAGGTLKNRLSVRPRTYCRRHHSLTHYDPSKPLLLSCGLAERAIQTLKNALKKNPGGVSLPTQIYRFLFQYRLTPHSTTGIAPAELLLGRRPRSHLDFLFPDITDWVRRKQFEEKANHRRERQLGVGQELACLFVMAARNYISGSYSTEVSGNPHGWLRVRQTH